MRLMLFGATGGTGKALVAQALEAGHEVTALVRDPARLDAAQVDANRSKLNVITGDVLEPETFTDAVAGHDAVLSVLGAATGIRQSRKGVTVYSEGTRNIRRAMRNNEVRRLIAVTAGGVEPREDMPFLYKHVFRHLLKPIFEDMRRMELETAKSALDWTIVRPPELLDTPKTGIYRVTKGDLPPRGWKIARADVAGFMLDELEANAHVQQFVSVAY